MENENKQPAKEQKFFTTCLQDFELHGTKYHEGQLISYTEANYLIQNMNEAKLISPTHLETN